jgi:hypothetical protein
MSETPLFRSCPACGSQKFTVQRVITVYQSLFIHAVEPDGTYYEDGDELGETLNTEDVDAAECQECGADVPLTHLFPNAPR